MRCLISGQYCHLLLIGRDVPARDPNRHRCARNNEMTRTDHYNGQDVVLLYGIKNGWAED